LAFSRYNGHWIILAIDAFLNLMYLLEIAIGILIGASYFSKCSNWVDVIICLACWVLSGLNLEEISRKN